MIDNMFNPLKNVRNSERAFCFLGDFPIEVSNHHVVWPDKGPMVIFSQPSAGFQDLPREERLNQNTPLIPGLHHVEMLFFKGAYSRALNERGYQQYPT